MPLQAQQICALARQAAKTPTFTVQSGEFLNATLSDLCQTYDLDLAKGVFNFNFNPGLGGGVIGGPYPLPADYLRAKYMDAFYTISGYPYFMVPVDLAEFDQTPQAPGLQSFPTFFATDMSQSPPVAYFYPPPSGAYPTTIRYQRQMPDIATPESSAAIPWFPNDEYLIKKVAGLLMQLSDDGRADAFLGRTKEKTGALDIIDRYLMLKDDSTNRADSVKLDQRRFGMGHKVLPTKAQPL